MKKSLLLTLVISLFISSSWAQSFVPSFKSFSGKKTTYITMEDGTSIEGRLKSLKFKKGLIEELKIKDLDDKKIKIDPEDIKFMYVPPSGIAKLANRIEASSELKRLQDGELTSQYLDDGYLYMEKSKVKIKKKTNSYMMQLVNPSYSGKIKIYNDPNAKEGLKRKYVGGASIFGLWKRMY